MEICVGFYNANSDKVVTIEFNPGCHTTFLTKLNMTVQDLTNPWRFAFHKYGGRTQISINFASAPLEEEMPHGILGVKDKA